MDKMEKSFFKKILVATDGSESAVNAVSHGINIAKATGAEVHVLYVISTEYAVTTRTVRGWTDEFEESLAKRGAVAIDYVKGLGKEAGIKVEPVFLRGTPAEEILDYAEDNDIDLIMMGTHGLTGVKRFLIGSVAEKVLRHSKIPVMIIR
ncbi:universal stress protein [Methanosarcina sp. Ant1]|nr:universal stress protein [Methanosarcina sp. Ant1]